MAVMCEPQELYNLLNQSRRVSRLAEINYLLLIDTREAKDYYTGHIITAVNVKRDSEGNFVLPEPVELDSMQHVVVYDSNTSCLKDEGRAADCAKAFSRASLYPVKILGGGFERFSVLYTFLWTEKILYTISELENLKTHPAEIIAGLLFMGDHKQSMDSSILKDLKIRAVINVSDGDAVEVKREDMAVLDIPTADTETPDLYSSFEKICDFTSSHINAGSRVLIVSKYGRSRCSAASIAFLMHHKKITLEEAWRHLLHCKPSMRPNTDFVQQLSDWELHTLKSRVTDISEPCF